MDELSHQEQDLYNAIKELMEGRGYAVIPQFKTFSPLTDSTRKLDLLGFRWTEDGDLDAWAVEAKQGESPAHTLAALGQAIEYQLYVPRVSVAAEVSRENLSFAESPIRQLGLGYIHASPKLATEIIAPAFSPRCYQNEFNQVIRHAGVLCLLGRKQWKKEDCQEHHSGGEETSKTAGYPVYAIHNNDPVQYMLSSSGKSKKVQLEIWIERKPVLTSIYRQIEAEQLAELLAKSEATATISKFQRDNFGKLRYCGEQRQLPIEQTDVDKDLHVAREWLKEDRVSPVISVAINLWEWESMPRFAEAKKMVENGIKQLEPIRAYLAEKAKKS